MIHTVNLFFHYLVRGVGGSFSLGREGQKVLEHFKILSDITRGKRK